MPHVTFIHGMANKPAPDALLRLWRVSLARDQGLDLGAEGVSSKMIYWADVLYDGPQPDMAEHESNDSVIARGDADVEMTWRSHLTGDDKAWVESLARRLNFEAAAPEGDEEFAPPEAGMESTDFERIPLPWWLKRRLMKILLRDVHHYLFNSEHSPRQGESYRVQDEIRRRMVGALQEGSAQSGPHIVVSHSMGTVIAYDCLKRVPDCPRVDGLITIGSPLGMDEIQDRLKPEWSRRDGFPARAGSDWVNVFDRLDPVAGLDAEISNDYQRANEQIIKDIQEQNYGRWRHNISKYLGGARLRNELARQLGL